jgi:hypothetical protein
LHGRELSFCLHPRGRLQQFLVEALPFSEATCLNR